MLKKVLAFLVKTFVKLVGVAMVVFSIKELVLPGINYAFWPELHRSVWIPEPVQMGIFILIIGLACTACGAFIALKRLPE